ncbi:MAG: DUF6941 family protein, partial [Limisphaerales bacterium]
VFVFALATASPRRKFVPAGMTIQIAVLCDAATDYSGKLNLLGTFDTIITSQLPAIHPQCSVALRISFNRIEEGSHKVKMNFVDEDGRLVMPSIDMPVDVAIPGDANFLVRNFIINVQQLKFDQPGQYSIDIAIDNRHEMSIPLLVKMQPAEAQMNQFDLDKPQA